MLFRSFLTRLIPAAAKMLRTVARCFPDLLFLGAKRWRGRVLRFLQRSGGNYYGTVEDLPGISRAEGLVIDPAVIDEIGSVEDMVRGPPRSPCALQDSMPVPAGWCLQPLVLRRTTTPAGP